MLAVFSLNSYLFRKCIPEWRALKDSNLGKQFLALRDDGLKNSLQNLEFRQTNTVTSTNFLPTDEFDNEDDYNDYTDVEDEFDNSHNLLGGPSILKPADSRSQSVFCMYINHHC